MIADGMLELMGRLSVMQNIETEYNACPVCSSTIKPWKQKQSRDKKYNICLCCSCGYCFVNPRPTKEYLNEYYSSVEQKKLSDRPETLEAVIDAERVYPNSSVDAKRIITSIKRHMGNDLKDAKLLDVGCGSGFYTKEAMDSGFNVTCIELGKRERTVTEKMTGLVPINTSFEDFKTDNGTFDAVLMSQVLEHAYDVNEWISKSYDILRPGGVIAVALPNYNSIIRMILKERDPFICPPEHLNFFNKSSLLKLLLKHGFQVVEAGSISRLPIETFSKRLPYLGKGTAKIIANIANGMFKPFNLIRMGMMLNIYAKKHA